jgi:hypothetical protein
MPGCKVACNSAALSKSSPAHCGRMARPCPRTCAGPTDCVGVFIGRMHDHTHPPTSNTCLVAAAQSPVRSAHRPSCPSCYHGVTRAPACKAPAQSVARDGCGLKVVRFGVFFAWVCIQPMGVRLVQPHSGHPPHARVAHAIRLECAHMCMLLSWGNGARAVYSTLTKLPHERRGWLQAVKALCQTRWHLSAPAPLRLR